MNRGLAAAKRKMRQRRSDEFHHSLFKYTVAVLTDGSTAFVPCQHPEEFPRIFLVDDHPAKYPSPRQRRLQEAEDAAAATAEIEAANVKAARKRGTPFKSN